MALSETKICNMALGMIGAKRLNNLDTDSSVEAIYCRTYYESVRDALLRSHRWRFASARASLSEDTEEPDFEWDAQFHLPSDFLALKSVYEDNITTRKNTLYSYALEGDLLLTNESSANIRYIKKVTDTAKFDPLFVQVLVLSLALKLVMPLSQDKVFYKEVKDELYKEVMPRVRAMDRQETETYGRSDLYPWNNARSGLSGRIDSKLGS